MMEDRERIREIAGIANARRVTAAVADNGIQQVTVTDGGSEVRIALSTSSYPAGLTPAHARKLALQLINSAKRIEERAKA